MHPKNAHFYGKLKGGVKNKRIITQNFLKLYNEAISLSFLFKVVIIILFSNWRCGIEVKEFNRKGFCVCEKKSSWIAWL